MKENSISIPLSLLVLILLSMSNISIAQRQYSLSDAYFDIFVFGPEKERKALLAR